ncbi:UNVERIFIED_CONTAM: hypothetical protein FKN15_018925 [Acipenser sinensis]
MKNDFPNHGDKSPPWRVSSWKCVLMFDSLILLSAVPLHSILPVCLEFMSCLVSGSLSLNHELALFGKR